MSLLARIRKKGFGGCLRYAGVKMGLCPPPYNLWSGDYLTWEDACRDAAGYDEASILEKVFEANMKVKRGEAVYERDSVVFNHIEYSWPLLSGLMWGAALHQGNLRMIDFGGSLGSTFRQNKFFLNTLSNVSWNIVEQPHFVEAGQKYFLENDLFFFESIQACCACKQIDGILFSSVLQYLEDPYAFLKSLREYCFDYILIDRTPFSPDDKDKITVQHVPDEIYKASYPCHFLSSSRFLEAIGEKEYRIVEWFVPELEKTLSYRGCFLKRINHHDI